MSGNDEYVRLNNQTISDDEETGNIIAADTIRFVRVNPDVQVAVIASAGQASGMNSNDAGHHGLTCPPTPDYSFDDPEIYLGHCQATIPSSNPATGHPIVSGFRFENVTVPQGVTIQQAIMQFKVDGQGPNMNDTDPLNLRIRGELAHTTAPFDNGNTPHSVTSLTSASIPWNISSSDPWSVHLDSQFSPEITSIVQELVDLTGWQSGNAMTMIIEPQPGSSGVVNRRVWAYERSGNPDLTTQLQIWYRTSQNLTTEDSPFLEQNGEVVMQAENYTRSFAGSEGHEWEERVTFTGYLGTAAMQAWPNTGENTSLSTTGAELQYDVTFQNAGTYYVYARGLDADGNNSDDSIHIGLNGQSVTNSGYGMAGFDATYEWLGKHNGQDTTLTIPAPGTYTINLWMREDGVVIDKLWLTTTRQGGLHGSQTTNCPAESPHTNGSTTLTATWRVDQGIDDVEEDTGDGSITRFNDDLDLGESGDQIVGVRFSDVAVPQGATITKAYIEFEADGTHIDDITLTIQGEDADDAAPFAWGNYGVVNRADTDASVSWVPAFWTEIDEHHQTSDLTAIVQEIVNRGGWQNGNAMAFTIQGSDIGKRDADSYDGDENGAPFLLIEYTVP